MSTVVVQRFFPVAASEQTLADLLNELKECLEQNRVQHRITHLSLDGLRTVCIFESPDAEAVRRVGRQAQTVGEVWPAAVHLPETPAAAPAGEVVVVERSFATPADFEPLQELEQRGAACLAQHRVAFLRSYFALDRRRMACIYAAPDAESVRVAQKKIGMPFDEVWAARVVSS